MSNRHQLTIHLSEGMPALNIDVLEEDWQKLYERLRAVAAPNPPPAPSAKPAAPYRPSRKSMELVAPVVASLEAAPTPNDMSFFTLRTVDDRYVMLRPRFVQSVYSSTDGFGAPDNPEPYDGATTILFRGDESVRRVFPPDEAGIGDMVMDLERGPAFVPWISLVVDEGDELFFNARSVVYMIAATSRVLAAFEGFMKDSAG